MPVRPKANPWAAEHGLTSRFVFLYSGTLGKKHSPELLLALADEFRADPAVLVVVVAEGAGADWLREQVSVTPRPNLLQVSFQPFELLPDVLGAGDVLVTLLTSEAGASSVPSKTLSYLCAERPILAAVPPDNAIARLIEEQASAGLVSAPGDQQAFLHAARRLRHDPALRTRQGRSARAYAEKHFEPEHIVTRFEELVGAAGGRRK